MRLILSGILTLLCFHSNALAVGPIINTISNASASVSATYTAQPTLSAGSGVTWSKSYGHDDVTVNQSTGAVSWTIPAGFAREAFYIGVKAKNADGESEQIWIVKVGGGNYMYCGVGEDAAHDTLSECTALALSGDTIVVRAGTYSGAANLITNQGNGAVRGTLPPSGSDGIYTTVMAEKPGTVTLDGSGTDSPIYAYGNYQDCRDGTNGGGYTAAYLAFKGFIAKNGRMTGYASSPVMFNYAEHIKITHIMAYEGPDAGAAGIYITRSNYMLVENCAVWGKGRIPIVFYYSDHVIMRRSVGRSDYNDAAEPQVGMDFYVPNYARGQNLIMVDSLMNSPSRTNDAGAFCVSVGSSSSNIVDTVVSESIALNHEGRLINTSPQPMLASDPAVFRNIVGWGLKAKGNAASDTVAAAVVYSTHNTNISNMTLGDVSSPDMYLYKSGDGANRMIDGWDFTQSITDSIVANLQDYNGKGVIGLYQIETIDKVNIYNYAGSGTSPGAQPPAATYCNGSIGPCNTPTNTITTNPQVNGLLYLPRIEAGSALSTAGIGATVTYMRGKSGTMWGEEGYDDLTTTPMWPFPMEDLIKQEMCAYNLHGVNGNRGFCTYEGQTGINSLTSYVWEYLGNAMPADLYASTPTSTGITITTGGTISFGTGGGGSLEVVQ